MIMTVHITNLTFDALVGVYEEERKAVQEVIVNAEVAYEYSGEYLHHVDVASLIREDIVEHKYKVLEDALTEITTKLKAKYSNITNIHLKITKPAYKADYVFSASISV